MTYKVKISYKTDKNIISHEYNVLSDDIIEEYKKNNLLINIHSGRVNIYDDFIQKKYNKINCQLVSVKILKKRIIKQTMNKGKIPKHEDHINLS